MVIVVRGIKAIIRIASIFAAIRPRDVGAARRHIDVTGIDDHIVEVLLQCGDLAGLEVAALIQTVAAFDARQTHLRSLEHIPAAHVMAGCRNNIPLHTAAVSAIMFFAARFCTFGTLDRFIRAVLMAATTGDVGLGLAAEVAGALFLAGFNAGAGLDGLPCTPIVLAAGAGTGFRRAADGAAALLAAGIHAGAAGAMPVTPAVGAPGVTFRDFTADGTNAVLHATFFAARDMRVPGPNVITWAVLIPCPGSLADRAGIGLGFRDLAVSRRAAEPLATVPVMVAICQFRM